MAIVRGILIWLMVLTLGLGSLSAQLPSRSEIDKAVNPSLSVIAKRAVRAELSTIELGTIKHDEQPEVRFKLRNTSATTVAITQLRSTCSCLKVMTKPTTLHPNEELDVVAVFNPAGRSGKVKLDIFIYTSLDENSPTERLTITGTMAQSTEFSHLRIVMGELRLSRKSVTLDNIKVGTTRSERIAVANVGDRAVTLSASSSTSGLSLRLEPKRLQPGEEGNIIVSYTASKPLSEDIQTVLILEGCSGRPSDRMIKITIKR